MPVLIVGPGKDWTDFSLIGKRFQLKRSWAVINLNADVFLIHDGLHRFFRFGLLTDGECIGRR